MAIISFMIQTPGVIVTKPFFSVTDILDKQVRVFVLENFARLLVNMRAKPRAHLYSGLLQGAPHNACLIKLASDKHSSLFLQLQMQGREYAIVFVHKKPLQLSLSNAGK